MGWFSWLFGEKEEKPAEPLVLGAELRCPAGTAHSYLMLPTDHIDINKLPKACVTDRKENVNIMPFGNCRHHEIPCEMCMKLEDQWINEEPQRMLLNGKEVITTKSVLICKDHYEEIEAVTSGQDGVEAARIAEEIELIREMDEKYPGLWEILIDPYASLYLKDGMYLMALQFLEDCIEKRGGEIRIEDIVTEDSLEMRLIIQAIAHLDLSCDAERPDMFVEVLTTRGYNYGMSIGTGLDAHVIDATMMEMLRRDSEDTAKQIETNGYYRFGEEHIREISMFSEMAFQFSLACLYCQSIESRQRVEVVREQVEAIESEAAVQGEGGSKTSLNDLPENVQNSFNRYEKEGWQGNVSGQTPGTNAGRRWANRNSQLPTVDANGNPTTYREYDVNNYNGFSRDSERFIVGSDGSVWYTDSHYGEGTSLNGIADFVQIK